MYGYIYKTTNLINNKIYIGQHAAKQFEPNKYIGSGKLLLRAIKKYGKANFKNELLEACESREELDKAEQYYITKFKSYKHDIGYNIQRGGEGNTAGSICINKNGEEKFILPDEIDDYLNEGWTKGRDKDRYVNGMVGKHQSDKQKAAVAKSQHERVFTDKMRKTLSDCKKIPNKFVCLRTPDNHSTIRCDIKNKEKYLKLGYLECKSQ